MKISEAVPYANLNYSDNSIKREQRGTLFFYVDNLEVFFFFNLINSDKYV